MSFKPYTFTKLSLYLGAIFFFAEFFLHFFGLPILEHDRIFIYTHDRYIALFALTYSFLLFFCSTDLKKYDFLLKATLLGVLFGMLNAYWISAQGGYHVLFPTLTLDQDLSALGAGFLFWYAAFLVSWRLRK